MNNKILVNIIVPSIESSFNVYIPINKKIGTIKKCILKCIGELSDGYFEYEDKVIILDRDTGKEFDNNMYLKDTDIKNGTKLIII